MRLVGVYPDGTNTVGWIGAGRRTDRSARRVGGRYRPVSYVPPRWAAAAGRPTARSLGPPHKREFCAFWYGPPLPRCNLGPTWWCHAWTDFVVSDSTLPWQALPNRTLTVRVDGWVLVVHRCRKKGTHRFIVLRQPSLSQGLASVTSGVRESTREAMLAAEQAMYLRDPRSKVAGRD